MSHDFTVDDDLSIVFADATHNMEELSLIDVEGCSVVFAATSEAVVRILQATVSSGGINSTVVACTGFNSGLQVHLTETYLAVQIQLKCNRSRCVNIPYSHFKQALFADHYASTVGRNPRFNSDVLRQQISNDSFPS